MADMTAQEKAIKEFSRRIKITEDALTNHTERDVKKFPLIKKMDEGLIEQLVLYKTALSALQAQVPTKKDTWGEDEDDIWCPICNQRWNKCDNDTDTFNFCPKCGAKLEEPDSE